MPTLAALERLARNSSLRFAASLVLALAYVCIVVSGHIGLGLDLAAIALGSTWLLWRRYPMVALGIGAAVLAVAVVRFGMNPGYLQNIAPFTALVVPILGASLDHRTRVRAAGLGLAVAAFVATVVWASADLIGQSEALVLPAAVLLVAPIALGAVWRRDEWREVALHFVRDRLPGQGDTGDRFRVAVGAAAVLYVVCVLLEATSGNATILLTALPIAAALPFAFTRPDLSLGLTALGLLGLALTPVFTFRFGAGDVLAMLLGIASVFGAALHGTPLHRRLAMGLVAATAVVTVGFTGAGLYFGLLVLLLGGVLPFGAAFAWRQWRTAGGLQARLTQSRERERAAERDVVLEQERNRIAREVHDVVAHSLAVVIAQADGARYAAQGDPATVGPALEAIADTARDALGEVRTMLHDLRTSGDHAGGRGAADLPALVDGLRALGTEVHESVYGEPGALDEQADAAVYRIVQEALTNALRHGRRDGAIDLELDWGTQALVVVVGNALPDLPREATERAGHGIPGMRERAALAGGECTAGVGSTGVFRVRASLPVLPAAAPAVPPEPADATTDVFAFLTADPARA